MTESLPEERRRRNAPKHRATIVWVNQGPDFPTGQYSREHQWQLDGGLTLPASPSPHVVPAPWSTAAAIDPEEAFVAAIASCHMLTFLWLASRAGLVVSQYRDEAVGILTKNERRIPWVSEVTLHPVIDWAEATQPDPQTIAELHRRAHEECFIANSVKTTITVALAADEATA